jgi:thymidylate synthase
MVIVEANDVSTAWANAFIRIADSAPPHEASILITNVTFAQPGQIVERQEVRDVIEKELGSRARHKPETVANTIFPQHTWARSSTREELYRRYAIMLPRLKKRCAANANGTYFARLAGDGFNRNQIEHVITTYNQGNHRRSALVATIFDPNRDHNHQRQHGFPCLHYVAFAPFGADGLTVTGMYATQYLFDRAYGNYLGLARLAEFVAGQIGKTLVGLTCIANTAVLGNISVADARAIAESLKDIV